MSKHMVFTSIEARLKGHNVVLTAIGPDDNEVPIVIDGSDIRSQYGMNPAAFIDANENDTDALFDLFHSVYGIAYAD